MDCERLLWEYYAQLVQRSQRPSEPPSSWIGRECKNRQKEVCLCQKWLNYIYTEKLRQWLSLFDDPEVVDDDSQKTLKIVVLFRNSDRFVTWTNKARAYQCNLLKVLKRRGKFFKMLTLNSNIRSGGSEEINKALATYILFKKVNDVISSIHSSSRILSTTVMWIQG